MMIPERPSLERRVLASLEGTEAGPRIPVLLGGCGSGKTSVLLRLRDLIGGGATQYIDVERIATTPERCLRAIADSSPFAAQMYAQAPGAEPGAREAFDALLARLDCARAGGNAPATFLLDEFLELRTFESFPGLRSVLRDLTTTLGSSPNRFVLSTRYAARARRLLRDAPAKFEMIDIAPLTAAEIRATMSGAPEHRGAGAALREERDDQARSELARMVQALSNGRPLYARAIADTAIALSSHGDADPVSALTAQLAPGGQLAAACRFCYELRLHRARGYGALKAILDVLAQDEALTLTEIALRLRRTPGSTKDYLSWLEDVDLIVSHQKRYSFADPILRLWVRLHCRPTPPSEEEVASEVHAYVLGRLPAAEPALALAVAESDTNADAGKKWGLSMEID
jgi:hypothetical protein